MIIKNEVMQRIKSIKSVEPGRLALLDLFRVIAIIFVLTVHVGQAAEYPIARFFGIENFYWVTIGDIGVTIFIILSGLSIELSYGKKAFNYINFMIGRILRIYPILWFSIFLGIIVFLFRSQIGEQLSPLSEQIGWLLFHMSGFSGYGGFVSDPFLVPAWFIGLIMTMYIVYPLLAKSVRKRPHTTLIAMLIISVVSRIILGQYEFLPNRSLDWFPTCRVFEFTLGIYLAIVVKQSFWSCLNCSRRLNSILKFMGDISFPLYLVHGPMLPIIVQYWRFGISQWIAIIIFLILSVSISCLVTLLVKVIVPRKKILQKISERNNLKEVTLAVNSEELGNIVAKD